MKHHLTDIFDSVESAGDTLFSLLTIKRDYTKEVFIDNNYTPLEGDISVLPQNSHSAFGHIAIYNGEKWVSDFEQRGEILPSKAYRANGKYQIFRATDGWHWKHVWTSPVDWYRWAETVVIFCKNTWKAYLG